MIKPDVTTGDLLVALARRLDDMQDDILSRTLALKSARGDWNVVAAALSQCLTQMHRMKGLFADVDGEIARAIMDAEIALRTTPTPNPLPQELEHQS